MGDSIDFELMSKITFVLPSVMSSNGTYRVDESDRLVGVGWCCNADELNHV